MDKGWRVATWTVLTLLLAAVLWGGWQWMRRGEAEAMQLAQQQRALYELTAQVEQAQVLLAKSSVAGTEEQRILLLTEAWRQAFGGQANLHQLPLGREVLMRTSQLLAQAGDYAYMLARRAASGHHPTEEERRTLAELQEQLGLVAERLHEVISRAAQGGRLSWRELRDLTNARLADAPNGLRDGLDELGRQLVEFPTLIYDGPFSDHVAERAPKELTGEPVDEQGARDAALQFLADEAEGADVTMTGEAEGSLPAWQIRLRRGDRIIDMDVSQTGGHVIWMLDGRTVGEAKLTEEEALERARRFLAERGYENVIPTWISKTRDRVIIPFVAVDDDVVLYPDMVKVTVALDDGSVIGFDAFGYLMSRRERRLPEPLVDEEEARRIAHDGLTLDEGRLAVIPLDTLEEVLTWEFPAEAEGGRYMVYVNALTGKEERILKLLDTEEGSLVL